jgi:hypothetical protein
VTASFDSIPSYFRTFFHKVFLSKSLGRPESTIVRIALGSVVFGVAADAVAGVGTTGVDTAGVVVEASGSEVLMDAIVEVCSSFR